MVETIVTTRGEPARAGGRGAAWLLATLALVLVAPAAAQRGREGRERREALRELTERMQDPEPAKRRVGVKRLAELGTKEAWQLVIEALADPEPEVADEAQWRLSGLTDEKLVGRLLSRDGLSSRDPWVRLRVAEAFGRMEGPLDGRALLSAVRAREPDTARALLWSLERCAGGGALAGDRGRLARDLAKLARGRADADVRASALAALLALAGQDAGEAQRAALGDREPALRIAALERVELLGEEEAAARAIRLVVDPARAVRLAAVVALERLGTREAARVLVERLAAEPRPRLRLRALAALRSLSGLKHRLDPRPWRDWVAGLPEGWRAGTRIRPGPSPGGTVAFAGLPIVSDRVAFLIDFSGSLWNERSDGTTRKEKVDAAIEAALSGLPEDTLFGLIPYTAEPHPWQERLVPVERRNVRAAIGWFRECRVRGKGNVFDAALLALRDPRVDTLCILTDGAPTGGHRWKLDLMVPLLVEAARFRGVAFDSIVVDAPPRLERHWAALAEATGGRSIAIEMDPPETAPPEEPGRRPGEGGRRGR